MIRKRFVQLAADRRIVGDVIVDQHEAEPWPPLPAGLVEVLGATAALEQLVGRVLAPDGTAGPLPPPPRVISVRAFLRLFTPAEHTLVVQLQETNTLLRYWRDLLCVGHELDLAHPDVANGLTVHRLAGVFGPADSPAAAARVARMLAGLPPL